MCFLVAATKSVTPGAAEDSQKKMITQHESAQIFILTITLLVLIPMSHTLRCLTCEGNYCKDADVGHPTVCRPGFDVCMKVKSTPQRVERVCGTLDACGFGVSENWGRRLYRQIKKAMGEAQNRSPWEKEDFDKQKEVFCCESDFCNKGAGISNSVPLALLISHILVFFYWKLFFNRMS